MEKKICERYREEIKNLLDVLDFNGEGDREIIYDIKMVIIKHALKLCGVRFDSSKKEFVRYPE